MYESIVEALLVSPEPAIRWKVRSRVLGERADSPQITTLREEIRAAETVRRLLAPLAAARPPGPYSKWQGAHWVLGALADLGYPPGDEALLPLREQVLDTWLHESYYRDVEVATKSAAYCHAGVPVMRGRHRVHASQQGYALWFLASLGLADGHRRRLDGATGSGTFPPVKERWGGSGGIEVRRDGATPKTRQGDQAGHVGRKETL